MRRILIFLTFIIFMVHFWLAFNPGRVEPDVRNILYFHVPSSICALLSFVVILIGSIGFLVNGKPKWDYLAAAAAQAGLVFATVLNITGMVFSRAEWNIWWTPSPRLITSAILWFLYIAYMILRSSVPSAIRRAKICAVFGIIAFLDVPLVYISARLTPDMHRANVSFDTAAQSAAFGLGILATVSLATIMIWLRYDILKSTADLEEKLYH